MRGIHTSLELLDAHDVVGEVFAQRIHRHLSRVCNGLPVRLTLVRHRSFVTLRLGALGNNSRFNSGDAYAYSARVFGVHRAARRRTEEAGLSISRGSRRGKKCEA